MPQVAIKHASITDPDAKKAPKRLVVPPGDYAVIIMSATFGATKGKPPLAKVSVEFQVIHRFIEDEDNDLELKKRRIYQDFILEPSGEFPDIDAMRRHELVMLLDATETAYTDAGFNTDHLISKCVRITIKHRTSGENDDGTPRVFTNTTKIDTLEEIDEEDLV